VGDVANPDMSRRALAFFQHDLYDSLLMPVWRSLPRLHTTPTSRPDSIRDTHRLSYTLFFLVTHGLSEVFGLRVSLVQRLAWSFYLAFVASMYWIFPVSHYVAHRSLDLNTMVS
jgi:hypothetical protein